MSHFKNIYSRQAGDYHRLIAAEDTDNNLLPALESVTPLAGKQLLDLGTGTGRLPILLASQVESVVGLDLYADMLKENQHQRTQHGGLWDLLQANMRALPLKSDSADIVTAGWAIGHLRDWFADDWQAVMAQVIREMHRVAKPNGCLLIMETMTTGSLQPAPPTSALAEYYQWLETEWGFTGQVVQTDYQFATVDEAVAHTEFFFGPELSTTIRAHHWARLPEWTGLWHKYI